MVKIFFILVSVVACAALMFAMWLFLPGEVVSEGAVIFSIAFTAGIFFIGLYAFTNKEKIENVIKTGDFRSIFR